MIANFFPQTFLNLTLTLPKTHKQMLVFASKIRTILTRRVHFEHFSPQTLFFWFKKTNTVAMNKNFFWKNLIPHTIIGKKFFTSYLQQRKTQFSYEVLFYSLLLFTLQKQTLLTEFGCFLVRACTNVKGTRSFIF